MWIVVLKIVTEIVVANSKNCTQDDLPRLFGSFQHNGWASGVLQHPRRTYMINSSIELEERCLCQRVVQPVRGSLSEKALDSTVVFERSMSPYVINQVLFQYQNNDTFSENGTEVNDQEQAYSLAMAQIMTVIRLKLYPLLAEHRVVKQYCSTMTIL